jgi:hypothetical protein
MRVGAEIGASSSFIDLDYADQVAAKRAATTDAGAPRVESLLEESHFKRSEYLRSLARKTGCRDHNDLWDHLFETRLADNRETLDVTQFVRDVAAWCHFSRADCSAAELNADGTLARESAMAEAIRNELAAGTERIIVVTGGFHAVVMPALVAERKTETKAGPSLRSGRQEEQDCLIRYSFEQLDALNGYSAGMPSPYYYDQLWHAVARDASPHATADVAAKVLVELGRLTRQKKLSAAVSPADEIAALEQARRLATLRGHAGPTREDLLDGIRSCFVKGSMDAEGELVLGLAHHALGGTSIGDVPAEAGVPPIVDDFRRTAKKLRLNVNDSIKRKSALDLYRKTSHRAISRFFHGLAFLEVPFATLVAGPDFVKGVDLERLFEHWTYRWSPRTESQLVEASVYGATIEEAAANRLALAVAELKDTGRSRSAAEAVTMLIRACRMGLHRHTNHLLEWIEEQVNDDPSVESLTSALGQLVLLWESREPLEAHGMTAIPVLIRSAYERAAFLLRDLGDTPPTAATGMLESLIAIHDLLRSGGVRSKDLDASLFYGALANVLTQPRCPALLVGGATGVLHAGGHMTDPELIALLSGSLRAVSDSSDNQTEFLIGLLRACRELAWRQPALATAVDTLLADWSDDDFIDRLPHLRMAFAELTPRETDQVATVVATLHGEDRIDVAYRSDMTADDMIAAVRLDAAVRHALEHDGLASWIEVA